MKLFPIMAEYGGHAKENTTDYIPWEVIAAHEEQAMRNHSQTLQRLAERGGLSYCEALAVIDDRPWCPMRQVDAKQTVYARIDRFGEKSATKDTEIDEMSTNIARNVADEYNKFLYSCFAQFDITPENIMTFKDRITVTEHSYANVKEQEFRLDSTPLFTITSVLDEFYLASTTLKHTIRLYRSI